MMDMHHIQLNEHEFNTIYTLCNNPFSNFSLNSRKRFETHGRDLEYIRMQDPSTIWTMVIDHEGQMCIRSGYHYDGRLAFYQTEESVAENQTISVTLEVPEGNSLFD